MLGPNKMLRRDVDGQDARSRQRRITAATTLTPLDIFVHATVSTAYPSYNITLPYVADAEGMVVTIAATVANSQAATIVDRDDSSTKWSDIPLDTDTDYVVLYCDGYYWHTLVNGVA